MKLATPEPVMVAYELVGFVFRTGESESHMLREGRDSIASTPEGYLLTFRDEAGQVVETIQVWNSHLMLMSRRPVLVEEAPANPDPDGDNESADAEDRLG
jgi:hypothetical protein